MSKIFELIRPKSLDNPDYEDYEYLLRWIGRDGSDYLYMFYDAEFKHSVSNEVINEQDGSKITSLINKISRSVSIKADDLSLSDLLIIGQINENKYVTRLFKNGTVEKYIPNANSFKYRLMEGRYEVTFSLVLADIKAWK